MSYSEAPEGAVVEIFKPEPPRPLMQEAPTSEDFPISAMTGTLKNAALAIHDKVECPVGLCAQSILGVATLSAQGHANVRLPINSNSPLSNFFITIAASGERKSGADNIALKPIRDFEADLRVRYETKIEQWYIDHATWKKEKEIILGQKKGATRESKRADLEELGSEPEKPLYPLMVAQEPTIEGLLKNWIFGEPSMGIFSAEGGVFMGGHGMSDENKLRSAGTYSLLWDGAPVNRVRAGDGITILTGRRMALHLMAQKGVAGKFLSDPVLLDQGFFARCLISAPESTQGSRFKRGHNPQSDRALDLYDKQVRYLLNRPFSLVDGKQNELKLRVIECSKPATELWFEFRDHVELQLRENGSMSSIPGLANKLPEHAARLAAVMTIFDDPDALEIGEEEMTGGIQLAMYYGKETLRLRKWAGISESIRKASSLLTWLQREGFDKIYPTIIYQLGPNEIRQQSQAKACLVTLEDHGWLRKIPSGCKIDGAHRREAWAVVKEKPNV